MTKTEQTILDKVGHINKAGALCGLGVSPQDPKYNNREFRFVKRLADAGKIVWVPYNAKHGAGWALPENVERLEC